MTSSPDSTPRLRVTLVAMPWSRRDRPSAAMAALASYVRGTCPRVQITCRSEFVETSERVGRDLYDEISNSAYRVGEMMYTSLLYPEKSGEVRGRFAEWAPEVLAGKGVAPAEDWGAVFDSTRKILLEDLEALAEELASSADVVGLTTCFGQLFANLTLAQAVKRRAPGVVIVFGGSTVSGRVGPSILTEYACVDYIIQGEGEQPLAALLTALSEGDGTKAAARPGILTRATAASHPKGAKLWEVADMNVLPVPDYDEYAERAEQHGIEWSLPLEGSRGCWWDRTRKSGNPKNTCYFCNLNVQWNGYREKSTGRVTAEMAALSERHKNLKIYFVDNIIRHKGAIDLADGIVALGKEFELFYEMRANVRPLEFVRLWEAGLTCTQVGIEGLSSALLRRIGKGTTAIQNLQAMRLCLEFGVENLANFIVDFPGATAEEVAETCENIRDYALSFRPPQLSRFFLGMDSTLDVLRDEFGLQRVRNADHYIGAVPADVLGRLQLFDLDYDLPRPGTSWDPVRKAVKEWVKLHEGHRGPPLLRYRDGGSFLVVDDERFGDVRSGVFEGLAREVYLFAMERRTREPLARRFAGHPEAGKLDEILAQFVEYKIMFNEKEEWLSLAAATTPQAAAKRIRAAEAEKAAPSAEKAAPAASANTAVALPVLG